MRVEDIEIQLDLEDDEPSPKPKEKKVRFKESLVTKETPEVPEEEPVTYI